MPELPEVETIARRLATLIPGKTLRSIEVHREKSFQGNISLVRNQLIKRVSRRAKIIQILFQNNLSFLVHLKMTGQLIYVDDHTRVGGGHPTADWVSALPTKYTRVTLHFSDKSHLFFNDMRVFGWVKVVDESGVEREFSSLGPDVIDKSLTADYVLQKLKNRRVPIKQIIMDNTLMCGLGNIYACDALNLSKIHPERPASSLSPTEVENLVTASKYVLQKGIEYGGTTIDNYVQVDGFAGKYQEVMRVYGRVGLPCRECKTRIMKIRVGGRGTYYCPNCQV